MIITLTVALFIQLVGIYALLVHAQLAQSLAGEVAEPANQRGRQAYYNAFLKQPAKMARGWDLVA